MKGEYKTITFNEPFVHLEPGSKRENNKHGRAILALSHAFDMFMGSNMHITEANDELEALPSELERVFGQGQI